MSSHNVHDVLDAITKAKEAYEVRPALHRRIDELEQALANERRKHDMLREEHEATEEARRQTEAKLRSVEAERDQYGFRNLELEEKLDKARSLLGIEAPATGSVDAKSAESVTTTEPVTHPTVGASSADTGSASQSSTSIESAQSSPVHQPTLPEPTADIVGVGQSADHPTNGTEIGGAATEAQTTASVPVQNTASVSTVTASGLAYDHDGRYTGWTHWSKPRDMTWGEFIDRGGKEPTYPYNRNETI